MAQNNYLLSYCGGVFEISFRLEHFFFSWAWARALANTIAMKLRYCTMLLHSEYRFSNRNTINNLLKVIGDQNVIIIIVPLLSFITIVAKAISSEYDLHNRILITIIAFHLEEAQKKQIALQKQREYYIKHNIFEIETLFCSYYFRRGKSWNVLNSKFRMSKWEKWQSHFSWNV